LFEYLKAFIADLITLLPSSVQNSESGDNTAAIDVLTLSKNLKKVFWGF
jgi:hypothetical protein